ncbi:Hypothetical predicted protein [Olea europaea subsp. europaea]|uniref:Uncharacterized protein n=1 Tax=Olea europaea subsp. europaea TaxID=158383 RepID=A0A8S0QGX7_OLEEU|nr:Hypothetical predicted protein [Olea europaea subsp. europaea]
MVKLNSNLPSLLTVALPPFLLVETNITPLPKWTVATLPNLLLLHVNGVEKIITQPRNVINLVKGQHHI